jgi:hypothetical protein
MVREFKEETGLLGIDWKQYVRLIDGNWYIDFFKAQSPNYDKVQTTTIEKVVIIETVKLFEVKCIPNLRWLIPMCLDPNHHDGILHTKRSTI